MKEIEVKEVVISNIARRGKGVKGDPIRVVMQIFSKDGELIAENDPCKPSLSKQDLIEMMVWVESESNGRALKSSDIEKWLDIKGISLD